MVQQTNTHENATTEQLHRQLLLEQTTYYMHRENREEFCLPCDGGCPDRFLPCPLVATIAVVATLRYSSAAVVVDGEVEPVVVVGGRGRGSRPGAVNDVEGEPDPCDDGRRWGSRLDAAADVGVDPNPARQLGFHGGEREGYGATREGGVAANVVSEEAAPAPAVVPRRRRLGFGGGEREVDGASERGGGATREGEVDKWVGIFFSARM